MVASSVDRPAHVPNQSPAPAGTTGTNAPGFKEAFTAAQNATRGYASGTVSETTVQNDWNAVGAIMEKQYQLARTSGNPAKAVAALDSQYDSYFRNNGLPALDYTNYYGQVARANIVAELKSQFGNGKNGAYTTAQIRAAATTVGQSNPSDAAVLPLVESNMEKGAPTGVFGLNGAGVPAADALKGESKVIDMELYGHTYQPFGRVTGAINSSTEYIIQQYLGGRMGNGNESPAQRLSDMMSVLGPTRTYAVLAYMPPSVAQQLGIQGSLSTLIKNSQFTVADVKALALAQTNFPTQYGDTNPVTAILNDMVQNTTSDPAKEQLFSQLYTAGAQLAQAGDTKQADIFDAYAADTLGSLSDKPQIAATLSAMGGVGADGAISPNSPLAKFLQSALTGQSQLGLGSPNGQVPQGVASLLQGLSGSRDTKLMAGTLDTVMQWTIKNPAQAEVLAAQDTGKDATGYRSALTNLLDKSFNQFVALNPSNPNATHVITMQPQTIADLQALAAVEMGPPYNSHIAETFANVFGTHAGQFATYAALGNQTTKGPYWTAINSLLTGGGNSGKSRVDPRNSAAVIFGQLMNAFDAGLNQSQTSFLSQAHDAKAAADQTLLDWRVVTDVARGLGTGTLLLSSAFSGGTATALSVLGRVGLFSGSIGTFILDAFFSGTDAQSEEQAVQKVEQGMQAADVTPTQAMQQMYDGFFSKISQLPGAEGQTITDGVMTGSSFAGAPTIETDVQSFYGAYNPMGYYLSQTGQYPAVS